MAKPAFWEADFFMRKSRNRDKNFGKTELYCKFFVSLSNCFNIKLTFEPTNLCYILHGFTKFYIIKHRQVDGCVKKKDEKTHKYKYHLCYGNQFNITYADSISR
jgi:hypothetical protein